MLKGFDEFLKRTFSDDDDEDGGEDEDEDVFSCPSSGIKRNPLVGSVSGFFMLTRGRASEIFSSLSKKSSTSRGVKLAQLKQGLDKK